MSNIDDSDVCKSCWKTIDGGLGVVFRKGNRWVFYCWDCYEKAQVKEHAQQTLSSVSVRS